MSKRANKIPRVNTLARHQRPAAATAEIGEVIGLNAEIP
jgi:hypothetical protein